MAGKNTPYTYAEAGVDIEAGNALVRAIGPLVKATARAGATSELGGFGGFFDPKAAGYEDPLLVAANDGVGTKLKLAIDYDRHDSVGIDLVAMCVNDLIVQGAEPLFFLDYFATGKLENGIAERVIAGIADGCLASSGVHSNGYSLVRRLAADLGWKLDRPALFDPERLLIDALIEPTRIYVASLLPLVREGLIHGLAHITGGGLLENIPRILPDGAHAHVDADLWPQPRLMAFLQAQGGIEPQEMARTFNCGVGMVLSVAAEDAEVVTARLEEAGETVVRVGEIRAGEAGCTVRGSQGTWGARDDWEATHLG